jgi:hypothetical protein
MRSPWKVIAGLVSRRKSAAPKERVDAAPEVLAQIDEADEPAIAGKLPEPPETKKPAFLPGHAQPAPLRSGVLSAEEPLAERKVGSGSRKPTQDSDIVPNDLTESNGPVGDHAHFPVVERTIAMVNRAERKDKFAQPPLILDALANASTVANAFEEALLLEDEINQLRTQLSQKLRQQNDELKRLLLRYDGR